jgi:hypothetical protein
MAVIYVELRPSKLIISVHTIKVIVQPTHKGQDYINNLQRMQNRQAPREMKF